MSVIEKLPGRIQSDPTITVKSSIGPKSLPVWFHGWPEDGRGRDRRQPDGTSRTREL